MYSTRGNEITSSPMEIDNNNDGTIEMNLCNKIATQMMLDSMADSTAAAQNIVGSPMSINLLLNMLAIGLRQGSTGQIHLMKALEVNSADEINNVSSRLMALMSESVDIGGRGPTLSIANGVWSDIKYPIKLKFHEIATQIYQADTRSFDFANKLDQVIDDVNSWAENHTKGLIQNLITPDSLKQDTVLILANALYFKGAWEDPFHKSMTHERLFYLNARETINAPFMRKTCYTCYGSFEGFNALKLRYQYDYGNLGFFDVFNAVKLPRRFSIYFFLPDQRTGLANLLNEFNSDPSLVPDTCKKLRNTYCAISIPKFKISFRFKPAEIMENLGLDLSAMSELTNIIGAAGGKLDMRQNSYIEVNEEGTEAASATYASVVGACAAASPPPPKPISFVADHPFFFAVRDDTSGAMLFTGIVRNPLLKP